MKNEIIELAFLRNHLVAGIFTEEDKKLLNYAKDVISNSETPFRGIALNAISNCEKDILNNNFNLAAKEINLIHNFHFKNPSTWNSDYFYKIELLDYLEKTTDVERIKNLIFELSKLQSLLNK